MSVTTASADPEARRRPVKLDCSGCGCQFVSTADRPVCPRCGGRARSGHLRAGRSHRPRPERTGQPVTEIVCAGCGLPFASASKTNAQCPQCGQWQRVPHRSPTVQTAAGNDAQQEPARTTGTTSGPTPAPSIAVPAASLLAASDDDQDDDGLTYLQERGRLVLAEWDPASRTVVPAVVLPAFYLARELPLREWLLSPHGADLCQVVRTWQAVAGVPASYEPCLRPAASGGLCRKCFEVLRSPAPA